VLNIEGFSVHSRLDAALLQQLARFTGGAYYHAATAEDLSAIYANLNPQLTLKPEIMEVTSLLAGLSLVLVLIGCGLSLAWFGRVP
jgi:Ca-activated chloride channel family protein